MTNATNPTTAQPHAAAANAPAAAPQAAPVSDTTITLGGKEVQLRGITPEQAQTLYAALPAEYQKRADAYAAIAKNFERVLKIDLKPGMSIGQAWKEYNDALNKGVNFAHDGVAPHLKQLDELVKGTPLAMLRRADTAATTIGRAADLASAGASDMLGLPGRALDLLSLMASEATGAVAGKVGMNGLSEEKAKAFGAVFAAAEFHESAVRQGMPVVDFSTNSVIWNYKSEAAGAAVEHATSTTAWTYIKAAFKFVANLLSSYLGDDKNKYEGVDFMQRLSKVWEQSEAEARAEQAAKDPSLTYEQRLVARVKAGETDRAAEKVQRAEVPQSLGTPEGLVAAVTGKALYAGIDGTTQHVTRNPSGTPAATALAGADGQPITRTDRVADAAGKLMPKTMEQLPNADRATVVGVASVSTVGAAGAAAAMYHTGRGAVEGVVRRVAERPDLAEKAARETADNLAKKIAAAEAAPKASGWQVWRTSPEKLAAMRTELEALKADMAAQSRATQAFQSNAGSFMQRAITPISELHQNTVARTVAYVTQGVGRVAGEVTGMVTNLGTSIAKAVGLKSVDTLKATVNTASEARVAASAVVESGTARAVSLYAAPVIEGGLMGAALLTGDQRGIEKGMWATGTIAASVAAGAGIGAVAGGVGAIPGAIAGLIAGSFTALVASHQAGKRYDARMEAANMATASPKPAGALGAPDKGLGDAVKAMAEANKQRLAQVAAESSDVVASARMAANRTPFAKVTSSQQVGVADLGSFKLDGGLPQWPASFAELSGIPMA